MSTLLNIAGRIDPETVTVFEKIDQATTELNMPYVVVGATARDLVMHHGHGAEIQRATSDVDFAIEVPSWAAYEILKEKLFEQGFRTNNANQRMISPMASPIDIIPFGDIENTQASIVWPPEGEITMNVLGFQEACDSAERIRIQDKPELDIPVVTPPGMMLLKLIAWTDRSSSLRKKDALDITYMLTNYEKIPDVTKTLYDDYPQIMETYDWDLTQAAARLLGLHANHIALESTYNEITKIADGELGILNFEKLTAEMCEHIDVEYDKNQQLISAFFAGFRKLDV